ncbi:hypothetical protein ABRQ00_13025 [Pectobacterium aroidearum]|uniref:hypothetical protein n=1 Tax=Pectobacterium aroidearum TaxID=1201031 RepID=UPI002FCACB91
MSVYVSMINASIAHEKYAQRKILMSLKKDTLVRDLLQQQHNAVKRTELVLSEISNFFASLDQPGAPETLDEMQAALMACIESVMRDHQ